jgi:hypothetical protein
VNLVSLLSVNDSDIVALKIYSLRVFVRYERVIDKRLSFTQSDVFPIKQAIDTFGAQKEASCVSLY